MDLPAGWQRCDGSIIGHPSPWAGSLTPDLNNEKRFLRGGHDGEQLQMEEDSMKSHSHSTKDAYLDMSGYVCPPNTIQIAAWGIQGGNTHDDLLCERGLESGQTGAGETKPKNMNVIFIIRVF